MICSECCRRDEELGCDTLEKESEEQAEAPRDVEVHLPWGKGRAAGEAARCRCAPHASAWCPPLLCLVAQPMAKIIVASSTWEAFFLEQK